MSGLRLVELKSGEQSIKPEVWAALSAEKGTGGRTSDAPATHQPDNRVTSLLGLRFLISKARGKVNQMTQKSLPIVTACLKQNEFPHLRGPFTYIPYELH